ADLLVEPARRAEMEARLTTCLERDVTTLLRLRADDKPCRLTYDRFDAHDVKGGGTVSIHAAADCGALPSKLTIDWGLFAGSSLDHVSVARIEQPHAEAKLAMLSKRASKLVVEITSDRRPLYAAVAIGALVLVVLIAVAVFVARRSRRSTNDRPA